MKLTDLLDRSAVVADLRGKTKAELVRELCVPLTQRSGGTGGLPPGCDLERLMQTLLDRERLGSTGLAEGVAIPHGKLKGLTRLVASFGRSLAGVDFDSLDQQPTHLFFTLFAPEASSGDHLRALARVSRLLRSASFRQRVLQASDGEAIYALIAAEDERF